jgi:NAD(P)-dependent dehydrogenase (short-subunit alcohol dehydrogenase family)
MEQTLGTPLAGLVALVTGGAGHLGAAMTATMARQGARVVVADLDRDRAAEHAAALTRDGFESLGIELDVASEASAAAAFAAAAERFGGLDILVNNAAPASVIRQDAPALDVDLATWDAVFDVVVRGSLICARQAIPRMVERGGGAIINISSSHARGGDLNLSAYPAAKTALYGLTRTLATQYGRSGIRCNSVTFATIPFPHMSAEVRKARMKHQLVPREGQPADAANIVAFLASPAASFLTGADYLCDGGVLAHLPSYADGGTWDVMRSAAKTAEGG